MYWCDSYGLIELNITKKQAHIGYHQGQCDNDIKDLRDLPTIKRQLNKLKPDIVARVLKDCGAWDDDDTSAACRAWRPCSCRRGAPPSKAITLALEEHDSSVSSSEATADNLSGRSYGWRRRIARAPIPM